MEAGVVVLGKGTLIESPGLAPGAGISPRGRGLVVQTPLPNPEGGHLLRPQQHTQTGRFILLSCQVPSWNAFKMHPSGCMQLTAAGSSRSGRFSDLRGSTGLRRSLGQRDPCWAPKVAGSGGPMQGQPRSKGEWGALRKNPPTGPGQERAVFPAPVGPPHEQVPGKVWVLAWRPAPLQPPLALPAPQSVPLCAAGTGLPGPPSQPCSLLFLETPPPGDLPWRPRRVGASFACWHPSTGPSPCPPLCRSAGPPGDQGFPDGRWSVPCSSLTCVEVRTSCCPLPTPTVLSGL